MAMARGWISCRNQACGEGMPLYERRWHGFCPSCWLMWKVGFRLGTEIVTAISAGMAFAAWFLKFRG